jgi:ribose transport system substrate-binding protein
MTGNSARREGIMANDRDNHEDGVSRRHALECMVCAGTGILWLSADVPGSLSLLGRAEAAPAIAQTKPTIPIIVKDTTSIYWQTVLAGARKAGQDFGANIAELGAQSDDANGQISILENAVSSNPAAVVIAPTHFAALGRPIDEAAKRVKIVSIDSAVDSNALTSFLTTDNVQAGRVAADILAERIQKTYADAEGDVALITPMPGVAALDQRAKGFKEQIAAKYGALNIVAEKVANGQATTARDIMAGIIAAYPELRGVFASNLITAKGAGEAVAENKTNRTGDKINLVGFDSDDELVKFLQDGTIAALVVQDPFRMGYEGVKTALAASKGEQVLANIATGAILITKANMNSVRSQELLNPKIK